MTTCDLRDQCQQTPPVRGGIRVHFHFGTGRAPEPIAKLG